MSDQDFQALNKEIKELRTRLNELESKKEKAFREYKKVKDELSKKISESKEFQVENQKTKETVSDLKKIRNEHNSNVRRLIREVRELNEKKLDLFKKYGIKRDVSEAKGEVKKLQEKLETEALAFDAEKKLMKRIKSLEKAYQGEVKELLDKIDEVSKRIDEEKAKADEYHKKVIEASKSSRFEGFLSLSKEIVELKKIQKLAFEEFVKFKKSFQSISETLRDRLMQATRVKELFDKKQKEKRKAHEEMKRRENDASDAKAKAFIERKQRIAEEKLKKGEKLTTEDLLALQSE